jgi:hypothetical protein
MSHMKNSFSRHFHSYQKRPQVIKIAFIMFLPVKFRLITSAPSVKNSLTRFNDVNDDLDRNVNERINLMTLCAVTDVEN